MGKHFDFSGFYYRSTDTTTIYSSGTKLYNKLKNCIKQATRSILIVSPYISISDDICNLLRDAADRGILIIIYIRTSDKHFKRGEWLESIKLINSIEGVNIFAVDGLHAKLYIFDSETSIVGSVNLIEHSLEFGGELALYLEQYSIITGLIEYVNTQIIPHAQPITELVSSITIQEQRTLPLKDIIFTFGVHKNTKLRQIPNSYLEWCVAEQVKVIIRGKPAWRLAQQELKYRTRNKLIIT